ncbi:sugar kinase [Evansella cellulosilytica]|uniref:PfkB domain protein n=1 Tax=Evansella cellulosilytica (strain ATCC 21833 / DSM 2522 / FERM P-1141 / JCM 9156 / N-4) TaxID=649639 RepID=E6TT31_EVAC2|nr:sugar kinase [Evansella cellulosilytica]ADU31939.1 PfkB domain protein [Evansella cellulosilytica DSM 2522]
MGKIIAFGEVMMRLEVERYKKLEQVNTLEYSFSGTGVNVLASLEKFGCDTLLLTKLPSNRLGDAAVAYINRLGINTSAIARGGEYIGMYFLEHGFHPRPSTVCYSNREESSFCTSSIEDYEVFQDASHIHFCGISLAISPKIREITITLAEKAKKEGLTASFDCNFRPKLWKEEKDVIKRAYEQMLEISDICFMTEKDAIHTLGLETEEKKKKKQIEHLLRIVARKYDIPIIAGTVRQHVASNEQTLQGFIVKEDNVVYSRNYPLTVYDRIGGGDGFASGILYGYFHRFDLKKMVEFATAAGVLAHTIAGDSPLSTAKDVWRLVNDLHDELER